MENALSINVPRSLALSLKMSDEEFELEFKRNAVLKLYEMGKISSGIAANSLNISRVEFLDILNKYSISCFDTTNLSMDISNA